jgi:ABC-type dipeptide/oligopeptide/nickel transport system permease component
MIPRALETVTWIKVEKPVFDLVGVVLNSLGLAFLCAVVSFSLGIVLGAYFVVRRRRQALTWSDEISLHLAGPDQPHA